MQFNQPLTRVSFYNEFMKWVYLSPHLDDAVLSCGGLIWEQIRSGGNVEIWTICAGAPPTGDLSGFAKELHERWGLGMDAVSKRRMEDQVACRILGAGHKHYDIPDAIYRRDPKTGEILYDSFDVILSGIHPGDEMLLKSMIPPM